AVTVTQLRAVDAAIQVHEAGAGRPVHSSPGTTSTAPTAIWAVMASRGRGLALTAAFQPACRAALASAPATWASSMGSTEPAPVEGGRTQPAVGHQCIVRHRAGALPAEPDIEPFGVAVGRVEHEQRFACPAGGLLGGAHEGGADAAAARPPVHEHLGHVRPVRLVLGLLEPHLHGADDAAPVLRNDQSAGAALDIGGDAGPELTGLRRRQRVHEA